MVNRIMPYLDDAPDEERKAALDDMRQRAHAFELLCKIEPDRSPVRMLQYGLQLQSGYILNNVGMFVLNPATGVWIQFVLVDSELVK